jgi:hypothetical protein
MVVERAASLLQKNERAERRNYQRVELALPGRYMLRDRTEYPCWTIDLSAGGVAIHGIVKGEIGERVVAFIRDIGWIEGMVVRHFERSFAINLQAAAAKRRRLANNIARLAERHLNGAPEKRSYERVPADNQAMIVKTDDGTEFFGKLLNVSFPGAALNVEAPLPVGAAVVVGDSAARVVRNFEGGIAVAFEGQSSGKLLKQIGGDNPLEGAEKILAR